MASPVPDGSPERAIYRAGSLTLSFCPVSARHVSNPERVILHEALWPEVPFDRIDASLQPTAFKHAPPNIKTTRHAPRLHACHICGGG